MTSQRAGIEEGAERDVAQQKRVIINSYDEEIVFRNRNPTRSQREARS